MLLAFINPSGPTSEPREVSVLIGDMLPFLQRSTPMEPTHPDRLAASRCLRSRAVIRA